MQTPAPVACPGSITTQYQGWSIITVVLETILINNGREVCHDWLQVPLPHGPGSHVLPHAYQDPAKHIPPSGQGACLNERSAVTLKITHSQEVDGSLTDEAERRKGQAREARCTPPSPCTKCLSFFGSPLPLRMNKPQLDGAGYNDEELPDFRKKGDKVHGKERMPRHGPQSKSSQFRGVTFYKRTGRWEAQIWHGSTQLYLGASKTKEEAAMIFDKAALLLNGENSDINYYPEAYQADIEVLNQLSKAQLIIQLRRESRGCGAQAKYPGVKVVKPQCYQATYKKDRKSKSSKLLGMFPTEEEAGRAIYKEAVRRRNVTLACLIMDTHHVRTLPCTLVKRKPPPDTLYPCEHAQGLDKTVMRKRTAPVTKPKRSVRRRAPPAAPAAPAPSAPSAAQGTFVEISITYQPMRSSPSSCLLTSGNAPSLRMLAVPDTGTLLLSVPPPSLQAAVQVPVQGALLQRPLTRAPPATALISSQRPVATQRAPELILPAESGARAPTTPAPPAAQPAGLPGEPRLVNVPAPRTVGTGAPPVVQAHTANPTHPVSTTHSSRAFRSFQVHNNRTRTTEAGGERNPAGVLLSVYNTSPTSNHLTIFQCNANATSYPDPPAEPVRPAHPMPGPIGDGFYHAWLVQMLMLESLAGALPPHYERWNPSRLVRPTTSPVLRPIARRSWSIEAPLIAPRDIRPATIVHSDINEIPGTADHRYAQG